jgi:hypothetical protein
VVLGLRAIGSALAQVFTHFTASLLGNLTAALLSVPLVLAIGAASFEARSFSLIPLGVAFLIGVLPNPCNGGVQVIARELAAGHFVSFQDYSVGLRRYARLAAMTWLVSLVVSAVLLANIAFYARAIGSSTAALRAIAPPLLFLWLLLFALWICIHLYVFPLLIEQEDKRIRLVYRNALLMVLARPSTTLVLVPVWLAILLLASATGLVTIIGLAVGAGIQQNATARLLPTFPMRHGT